MSCALFDKNTGTCNGGNWCGGKSNQNQTVTLKNITVLEMILNIVSITFKIVVIQVYKKILMIELLTPNLENGF